MEQKPVFEDPSPTPAASAEQQVIQEYQIVKTKTSSPLKSNSATKTTTTSKYVRDFESLFVPINVNKLRNNALNGNLRHSQFRSLCWRYFLSCLPEHYDDWLGACIESRKRYSEISAKHLECIKPKQATQSDIIDDKKTKLDTQSKTNTNSDNDIEHATNHDINDETSSLDCDYKTIYKTIERDVVRTFPDMEFFRQTEMQEILGNILFNFASENPQLSYKQGMHELLATLLYVAHTDSQNCLINYEGDYANEAIATLLDLKYLEHDVYHLFSALMKAIESWYQNDEVLIINDPAPTPAVVTTNSYNPRVGRSRYEDRARASTLTTTSLTKHKQQVSSVLGLKLKTISENIVRKYDLELFNHLEALQIAPQIYGIRWMRLLFSREYEFLDLLTVWDAIICDRVSMSLVDYVFASMLITIREELINGDYTDCLNNLMRHQFKDVHYVIRLASHLRDPSNFVRPKHHRTAMHNNQYNRSGQTYLNSTKQQQSATTSSLTNKLSQQYISDKLKNNDTKMGINYYHHSSMISPGQQSAGSQILVGNSTRAPRQDNEDKQYRFDLNKTGATISDVASSSINYLAQQATSRANNNFAQAVVSGTLASSKFLPNLNKIVSSIGNNKDKSINGPSDSGSASQQRANYINQQQQPRRNQHSQQLSPFNQGSLQSRGSGLNTHQHPSDLISTPRHQAFKEYEMREMVKSEQVAATSSSTNQRKKVPLGHPSFTSGGSNVSNESCEDLHSIVDYCWRLLSEQIDSLQRCLPKEKGLHSEDEIFVALAQLKKVRDVLKGSLRLEDELESSLAVANFSDSLAPSNED